jgi:hypothetical protein
VSSEPRNVTPQEAREALDSFEGWRRINVDVDPFTQRLARTVAGEAERTRSAVVKALDSVARGLEEDGFVLAASLVDKIADEMQKENPHG